MITWYVIDDDWATVITRWIEMNGEHYLRNCRWLRFSANELPDVSDPSQEYSEPIDSSSCR